MLTSILEIWTPDIGDEYAPVQDLAAMADTIEYAILNPPRVRIRSTADASPTSTQHGFQIGPDEAENLIADIDEIMARNGGAPARLSLNINGGDVAIGDSSTNLILTGRMNATHYPYAVSAGSYTFNPIAAGDVVTNTVNFPSSSRFTVAPIISLALFSTQPHLRAVGYSNVTSNSFDLTYSNVGGDAVSTPRVHWHAIQMNSSSSPG